MVTDQVVVLMQYSHLPKLFVVFYFFMPVMLLCLCICVNLIELNRTNNAFRENKFS